MRSSNRPLIVGALLLVFSLIFSACAAPVAAPAASDSGEEAAAASGLKVGLVTDVGRINDRSFNQSAWEGAQEAALALGASEEDTKYIETQDSKDYADNLQQFIDADYDVIVTVGFAMGEATAEAAANNPDINFIGIDQFQGEALPNLAGLVFHEDQSGYLAGALAAQLSETGTIGAVLGTDLVPPVVAFKEGYEAGAKAINPDINIISTYHPGGMDVAFTDPEWGANTARQAMDQGADVIFGAGGITGNGALQEVATAAEAGDAVFCIGVDTDQWETLPAAHSCLVSSATKRISDGVIDLINLANEGNFPGGNYFGGAGLAPFHDFEETIPQEIKDSLVEIADGLADGSIETGY